MADPVPNRFDLPEAKDIQAITWDGLTPVAGFTGLSIAQVPRPMIAVPSQRTEINSGRLDYAFGTSFAIVINDDSALTALVSALRGVISTLADLAGKGITEAAKKVEEELNKLISDRQFALGGTSNITVSRTDNDGEDDIFIRSTAVTNAELSSAGNGMAFTLRTELGSLTGKQVPGSAAAVEKKQEAGADAGALKQVDVATRDEHVFRLKPNSSGSVRLRVLAQALLSAKFTGATIKAVMDKVSALLKRFLGGPDNKVKKPEQAEGSTFKWSDFIDQAQSFIEEVARELVNSLKPRIAALVVKQTQVGFTAVSKKYVKDVLKVDPDELAFAPDVDLDLGGEYASLGLDGVLALPEAPEVDVSAAVIAAREASRPLEPGRERPRVPEIFTAMLAVDGDGEGANGGAEPTALGEELRLYRVVDRASGRRLLDIRRVDGNGQPLDITLDEVRPLLPDDLADDDIEIALVLGDAGRDG